MADRPIIFSGGMVKALLAGTKTQTRRAMKPQPFDVDGVWYVRHRGDEMRLDTLVGGHGGLMPWLVGDRLWVRENHQFHGASYNDGSESEPDWSEAEWFRVWGSGDPRDGWEPNFPDGWSPSRHMGVHDLVGPGHDEGPTVRGLATKVLPSIHMPRWASRLTLTVSEVRVQRLQDISDDDCFAEGLEKLDVTLGRNGEVAPLKQPMAANEWPQGECGERGYAQDGWDWPQAVYADLWESLHGHGSWKVNPWVAALTFTTTPANIDSLPEQP